MPEVTDGEVDAAVWKGDGWKAPDADGVQMAFVRMGWSVLGPWVRCLFKSSIRLALFPRIFKESEAFPTVKPAKKDRTHPKSYRPVEHHARILGKALERLVADRMVYQVETRGHLCESQFGGRPGRSAQQAVHAFVHRARARMDGGMVVS
ncbi:hypothetical protein B0H16DRAFT_1269327, partial [Mycena metata]